MTSNYVLIVDDDPNILEGLTHAIEKEFENKAIVLSCKNGAIAADILRCNTIDILLTDIKMPIMNGIELLNFIKDNHISCKSIILSSYDDFNLVRDAMRLGAADYLLKPVDFSVLYQLLYRLLAQVMSEQNSSDRRNYPFNIQQLLESYLQNPMIKTTNMLAFEEKYSLSASSACIVGCIKLDSIYSGELFQLQESLREDLYLYLNRYHIQYRNILTGEISSCFVFMLIPDTNISLCLDSLNSYADSLVNKNFKLKISKQYVTFGECSNAFKDCLNWFEFEYYDLPYNQDYEYYTTEDITDFINKAIHSLSIYDLKNTLHYLRLFFAVSNHQKPPVKETKKTLNTFIFALIRSNSKYIEPISRLKFSEYDLFNQIENAPTLSILEKELFNSLNYLLEVVIHSIPNKDDCIIEKAKLYIEKNYNECINLKDIANHVYMNKNYSSSFFKSKVGLTYREYLRNYRIDKSICFIADTDMKIYEIAQAVGYNDSAHFIRAFKKVTGKSPSDYKFCKRITKKF
jgi:two-component system response regulator YesN